MHDMKCMLDNQETNRTSLCVMKGEGHTKINEEKHRRPQKVRETCKKKPLGVLAMKNSEHRLEGRRFARRGGERKMWEETLDGEAGRQIDRQTGANNLPRSPCCVFEKQLAHAMSILCCFDES